MTLCFNVQSPRWPEREEEKGDRGGGAGLRERRIRRKEGEVLADWKQERAHIGSY